MRPLLRFIIPFGGLVLVIVIIKTISVVAHTENISAPVNASWNNGTNPTPSPVTEDGTIPVNTLQDERNSDEDYSLRETITAANPTSGQWYVTLNGDDSNDCLSVTTPCATINMALNKLGFVDGDTVFVSTGTYTATSGSEVVLLNKNSTLSGGWNTTFDNQLNFSTIDGGETKRGITIIDGVTATIDRFVVQNGQVFHDVGAGIKNQGDLSLIQSIIQNNTTDNFGGGSAAGIYNSGTLLMDKCSVMNNSTAKQIYDDAGGIMNDGGSIVLNHSSINNNFAGHYGGGIYNTNGGILVVNNSTISRNTAGELNLGGGIHNGFPDSGIVYLNNSTISDNIGSGILTHSSTVTMQNTILSGNLDSDGTTQQNCNGNIISHGYNLIGSTRYCDFSNTTGNLLDVNPLLFPLTGDPAFNPLSFASPAIDAGNPAGCKDNLGNPILDDQRGVPRPVDGDGDRLAICDIGSFEAEISPTLVILTGPYEGFVGESNFFTATVEPITTTLPLTYTWQTDWQPEIIHSSGLTDTVSYTWEMTGTQLITVTASNPDGSVADTHSITITDVPITGLTANNDSPKMLGEFTTFTNTITNGTNVSFTWDFGDKSNDNGGTITHTYTVPGIYTATVTAANSVSSLTETTQVCITAPFYPSYLPLVINSSGGILTPVVLLTSTPTPTLTVAASHIPIIEYHYSEYNVGNQVMMTTDWFESQMGWLADNDFTTLSAADLITYMNGGAFPQKSVILSFDLGSARRDNFINVIIPTLEKYKFTALFFLLVNDSVITDTCDNSGKFCWDDLRQWQQEGIASIESHGINHPDYATLTIAQMNWDAGQAFTTISAKMGVAPLGFAYPFDSIPSQAPKEIQSIGYQFAVGGYSRPDRSVEVMNPDRYSLPRVYPYSNMAIYPIIGGSNGKTFDQMIMSFIMSR